jgi:2-iminobutanoate/2-iminopropanoate deaminase
MNTVHTDNAPAAIGPYSQAVIHEHMVYCSGQIGLLPDGSWVNGGPAEEAAQALSNLQAVLTAAGSGLDLAVKVTVYLKDLADFGVVNTVYAKAFGDHRPARACIQAAELPKDALVEIDCVAAVR